MSSDSDEENAIRYGTPLEPFEEDEVPSKRKFQQQPDQIAVDAYGRRRFHGAFTGGFSAGFQNTVGSAEGWTPATFKSSRAEKAKAASQRPEDFMDEEDRSEFGIAPKHMQTHSEFSGQKRPRPRQFHDGPIPGEPVLDQVIRPVHETAAVRMLRAMGWRPGQGAGERVTREEKKKEKRRHKVYTCEMPPGYKQDENPQSEEDTTDSEYDYDTLFAPDDYEPYVLKRKSDRFGLGYSGLSRHSVLGNLVGEYGSEESTSHLRMKDKGKRVSIRGQAFGVGAFEAADEDIYATEDMSHYDFAIGGPRVEPKKKDNVKKSSNVLEGFVPSSKPFPSVAKYPPPALPRHYVPVMMGTHRTRFEPTEAPARDQGLGRHELTPEARGVLLGESIPKPLQKDQPTEKPTTTQPATPMQEDPIAKIIGRNVNFISMTEEPKELDYISIKDSGKEIQKVFKPFAGNPLKQQRYENFLKDREGYMAEGEGTMNKLSEWERNREFVEFEQAAKLYRPLTGEMGDKFTHASEPDDALNPLSAVAKSKNNHGPATPDQIAAAEKGLYGVMTRQVVSWQPDALVCKRFNVPQPGVSVEQPKVDKPKVSYSIFSYLENSVHNKESFAKEQTTFSGSKSLTTDITPKPNSSDSQSKTKSIPKPLSPEPSTSEKETGFVKRMTVAELFLKESEKDLKNQSRGVVVTDTIEKFDKMDLYKSIFLSDSEGEPEPHKDDEKINFDDFFVMPTNVERNNSPPRGIFANIDFDEINSWKRNADAKKPDKTKDSTNKDEGSKNNDVGKGQTEDFYGPKIPEDLQKRLEATEVAPNFKPVFRNQRSKEDEIHEVSSSSSDSWVDVKEVKSKKVKKKKSKKHKSKHKKSKHKKKDR